MRKIGSEREAERKKKRNTIIISIFVLAVLVLGTVGYGFISGPGLPDNDPSTNTEHGTATDLGNRWLVSIHGQNLPFTNNPNSTREIETNIQKTIADYTNQPLYISSDNDAITSEIGLTLGRYTSRAQKACYGSCPNEDIPEKNCSSNLIIWEDSTTNKVYQEENCIFIEGDMKAVDAFLFAVFEV